ncbi:biotin/lipoyl-containing protein [Metabacillus iocasae]|uniref:Acetyl-CoA carboxylase biotin carboxyl carrier protein n=1 Tax=Priestia iocasae TaxID=2291674 RepID=A0ABS2QSM7_9BACI|nr:biotin/lipoyl-containing protein [Metabacillus iocasae]MBM7701761.1 acetyl-CoA carboxylase biotin carboxyl carrier protein [Metabacillus iocasae]
MKEITANMAGMVLNVLVAEGSEVAPGEVVLLLESMKMEIPVESPSAGKVVALNVNVGDFVNEGDVLVTVE